ncbi:M1 family metallopeptidase [Ascoidea rubescens DSM 1968]|uniref:Aminopeptidase n=1 Tax=Ascoidea rubescens DSM 1968 TaxID=1344418 RepID=A0A1D2V9E1_9ASCO|nr:alanine/arginine aminopeptidase [Ascoidea rubescens DSM 1968]ODV58291.1 alanine/arginine aminopeptidase [Ascoidea rubescens DSM 1968]
MPSLALKSSQCRWWASAALAWFSVQLPLRSVSSLIFLSFSQSKQLHTNPPLSNHTSSHPTLTDYINFINYNCSYVSKKNCIGSYINTFFSSSFNPVSFNSSLSAFKSSTKVFVRNHFTHTCSRNLKFDMAPIAPSDREILPANIKPIRYDLTLEPDFETFKFNGSLNLHLFVIEPSNSITLNSLEIDILSATLSDNKSFSNEKPSSIEFNEKLQQVSFKFNKTFKKDSSLILSIKFIGLLNDKMAGFYRSSYIKDGKTKYLATTQMEPTDCRRAFPCFDEPALKSIFDITLIADKNLTCLSNMDVKSESVLPNDSSKKSVSFNSTPLMSTYLVAFIVGDLKYVECNDYKTPVRVYATPGLEHQGEFSCKLAAKTLDFFGKAFDIEYSLPHMNMVAIHDFSAGAMENWGLVTYRSVDLLFDEKTSSLTRKQRVAEVVQHELAHQWFGNLVTMDWWEGLWLNEGFATWMSWYSANQFYPSWNVWSEYVTDNLQSALIQDGLRSSHPVEVPVKRADEINQIFDAISYSKGSSLLKMISRWLGEDIFIKGVSNYLKKHKFSNTQTSDLWEALSDASGKNVVGVMDVWTKKVGFPVITVTEDGNKIHLKQNRYLTTGDVKPEEDQTIFPVFVGLRTKNGIDESIILNQRETTIEIDDPSFFKINADHAGIYRTVYTPERWVKLGQAGQSGLLPVEDRAGLIADAGALATSGYSSTTNLLNLVSSWKDEKEYIVWGEMLGQIGSIKAAWLFESESIKDSLKAFTRSLVSKKCKSLGWTFTDDEPFLEQRLKSTLFSSAISSEDKDVQNAALEMFNKFVKGDSNAIHPNLRPSVFRAVADLGGVEGYDQLLNIYKTATSLDEKITALSTLGLFKEPELIKRTLGYALDGSVVKPQDIYIPLRGLRAHKEGTIALFNWLKEKWDKIYALLPPGLSMLGSVVEICLSSYTTETSKSEIEEFFKDKDTAGYNKGIEKSLDRIQSVRSWISRDGKAIEEWLSENGFNK